MLWMEDIVLIATQAPKFLVPCGFLGLETGSAKQAYELKELLSKLSFSEVQVLSDLSGVERFVTALAPN